MNIAIVEDNAKERENLGKYIEQCSAESGQKFNVFEYCDSESFLDCFERGKFAIVFMDIEMPGMNGMSAAHRIRETDMDTVIIFVTNMRQYAVEGYSVGALDYMVKPFSYYDFQIKFKRAVGQAAKSVGINIILKNDTGTYKVYSADIRYVEVQNYNLIYAFADRKITVTGKMYELEKQLLPYGFFKCHRGYLVNLRHIDSVLESSVQIADEEIPMSRLRKKDLLAALTDFIGGRI